MDINCKGTWHSPDKQRTIRIRGTHGSYYDVTEYNKSTKHRQEIKIGKEGFDQFLSELKNGNWSHTNR